MTSVRHLNIILALAVLAFGFNSNVKAQAVCTPGYKIYLRADTGAAIENAKLEVSGVTERDKLPSYLRSYSEKNGIYIFYDLWDRKVEGDFLLKISADGYEAYERQFNFPICQIESFELKLRPAGSTEKASFERLFTVHGKVYDEEMKPFGNAKIEATYADGRTFQAASNAYGYYEIDLPKGSATIRVTDSKITDIVFADYKVEKNYSVLNIPVCLKCKQKETGN